MGKSHLEMENPVKMIEDVIWMITGGSPMTVETSV
jgi:hypothetical protein